VFAHYCLHELKLLPSQFDSLPKQEKAFVTASIKIKLEDEKKKMEEAKRKARR